jgi:hypothetical protein
MGLATIFLVCSAVCFGIGFAGFKTGQLNMIAGGLMFGVLSILFGG